MPLEEICWQDTCLCLSQKSWFYFNKTELAPSKYPVYLSIKKEQITFLDVIVKRTAAYQIETCVYRKGKELICVLTAMYPYHLNGKLEH